MLSKGKLREWFCPHCNSTLIIQIRLYGQNSYLCNTCNQWDEWGKRGTRKANTPPEPETQKAIANLRDCQERASRALNKSTIVFNETVLPIQDFGRSEF